MKVCEIIVEVFDRPYNWQWTQQEVNSFRAHFASAGGNVVVYFESLSHNSRNFEVGFKKDNNIKRTGEGNEFAIFATVINIISSFFKLNLTAESITFVAKREGAAAEDPKIKDSRSSLYKKMIQKFADKNGFEFAWSDIGRMTEFIIRKKQPATSSANRDL